MKKDLRVCHISDHGCIRVSKTIFAQLANHPTWTVSSVSIRPPMAWNHAHWTVQLQDPRMVGPEVGLKNYRDTLRLVDPQVDIFHIHNTPDDLITLARECNKKPIVYDVHDPECLQWGEAVDHEREAYEACDGVVHVSEPCDRKAREVYGYTKPSIVSPSLVNAKFHGPLAPAKREFRNIVYEGGISVVPTLAGPNGRSIPNYKFILGICNRFFEMGMPLCIFSGGQITPNEMLDVQRAGGHYLGSLPYVILLPTLQHFDLGWFGSEAPNAKYRAAEPNKVYEYISQGLVPVIWNADNAARFVRETGLGIVIDSIAELPKRLGECPEIRERILAKRMEFTMESNLHKLDGLYAQLLS